MERDADQSAARRTRPVYLLVAGVSLVLGGWWFLAAGVATGLCQTECEDWNDTQVAIVGVAVIAWVCGCLFAWRGRGRAFTVLAAIAFFSAFAWALITGS